MPSRREVLKMAIDFGQPPYTPWDVSLTHEAREKVVAHYGHDDLDEILKNHSVHVRGGHPLKDIGNGCFRDIFGVVWDKSMDKDIGIIKGAVLPEATLRGYEFPDPLDPIYFDRIPERIDAHPDRFRVFGIGFSLYERAWTMRGMENLMMDMIEHPEFVHELLTAIADWNIAQVRAAVGFDIDCVHFGDDWGQQHGLIMGPKFWREFIRPQLKRMYAAAKDAGKYVSIHSCGDVDELFDDLIDIGLDMFNPFQPEVMDVGMLIAKYRGRLAFHGGLSTQKTLPYGSAADVRKEVGRLLEYGLNGGYVFAPAHAVEGDVPVENIVAFIGAVQSQPGFTG